ncbi:MAG: hypothetical protein QOI58_3422 [Thermoanaerobaculia bacterium]|jgi:hypothetical protein|nr:hypothetical protein [Thermoanaerobaculia bacterium]
MRVVIGLAVIGLLSSGMAAADTPVSKQRQASTFEIHEASGPIHVDGSLDEEAWKTATTIPLAYEWNPGDNLPPPTKTDVLLTFDRQNLYVGFRAYDAKPAAISAHLTDRDIPFNDDTVGFMIDTFNDQRRAFQFRVNPLGVQMDATNSDVDGSEDWSWNAIWASEGRITADRYVVEIAIPFTQLRFPRGSGVQTWGFMATRDWPRDNRHRLRTMPTDRGASCLICQFDKLTGFRDLRPGRNLELDPTITAHQTAERADFPDGPLKAGDAKIDPGLSMRWGVTPNVTVSAAVNPDFSQVEADAAQLAENQQFALFFPEKRPFFLEGADFFSTPINAVFTRTVANPDLGIKVTGKENKNAFGAVITRDRINNLIFPSYDGSGLDSIDQNVNAVVARYRRDVGKTSSIGVLFTGRSADGYSNAVSGIDGLFRFSQADSVTFQYLRSATEYPNAVAARNGQPAGNFSDDAVSIRWNHGARDWQWAIRYSDLGPLFRSDAGFVTRVDTKQPSGFIQRTLWGKPGQWYTKLQFFAGADWTTDSAGKIKENGQDFQVTYQGTRQTFVQATYSPNREYYRGVYYDNPRWNFYVEGRPSASFYGYFFVRGGKTIDFSNERQGHTLVAEPGMELNLGRRLSASFDHTFQRLDVAGGRLFTANLTQTTIVYHFNIRTLARAIVQLSDVTRDPSLYRFSIDRKSKDLFTQLLFSYKINPQTVFYFGYSDSSFGDDRVDLKRADRTLFLKIGYAWLL